MKRRRRRKRGKERRVVGGVRHDGKEQEKESKVDKGKMEIEGLWGWGVGPGAVPCSW